MISSFGDGNSLCVVCVISRCWTLGRSCQMITPLVRRRSSRGWPSLWTTGRNSMTYLERGEPATPHRCSRRICTYRNESTNVWLASGGGGWRSRWSTSSLWRMWRKKKRGLMRSWILWEVRTTETHWLLFRYCTVNISDFLKSFARLLKRPVGAFYLNYWIWLFMQKNS